VIEINAKSDVGLLSVTYIGKIGFKMTHSMTHNDICHKVTNQLIILIYLCNNNNNYLFIFIIQVVLEVQKSTTIIQNKHTKVQIEQFSIYS